MRGFALSPRLAAIAAQVPQGARLADIGTDHAYLPVSLLLAGTIHRAVASDVNQGPLRRGRETARLYGVEDKIEFRRCDGLTGLDAGQADAVVVAGMGGELIARILEAAPWTRDVLLLLQPMSAQPELRRWLNGNGYRIQRETLAREGEKLYVVFTVRGGRDTPYTLAEQWAGRQRQGTKDPYRLDYLDDLLHRRRRALDGMEQSSTLPREQLEEERRLVTQLERMREEWTGWQR